MLFVKSKDPVVLCLINGERYFAAAPTTIALRSAHRGETTAFTAMQLRSHGRPVSDCCRLLLLNSDHWCLNSSPKLLLDQRRRGHQDQLCQQLARAPEPLFVFEPTIWLLLRKIES